MHAQNIKISKDTERWELEVKAELPADAIASYRSETIAELAKDAKIDGFRPGKAPEAVIVKHYGEKAILEHAAEHAVKHELPELLAEQKANIVDAPRVSIEPLEPGKPVKFTARGPLAPEVTLADYKKIAAKHNKNKQDQAVTDEEHNAALAHLKRERARIDAIEGGKTPQEAAEHTKGLEEKDLPPLDDEFALAVGYESADNFTNAVRDNIKHEKELREAEKVRMATLDEIVAQSKINFPAILSDYELDDMEARLAGDLERMGMTVDKYYATIKKTREDLRQEWLPAAKQRAQVRLVLADIARKENIEPDQEALTREVAHAQEHYKNADPSILLAHISHAMRNESVMKWLEEQK